MSASGCVRSVLPAGLVRLTAARDTAVLARELVLLALDISRAQRAELVLIEEDREVGVAARTLALAERRFAWAPGMLLPVDEDTAGFALASRPDLDRCLASGDPVIPAEGTAPAVFPLEVGADIAGMLVLHCGQVPEPAMVETAARLASVCANHLGLLDECQRDALTGLLNRKTFLRHFSEPPQGRTSGPGASAGPAMVRWLGVVDIDHFKSVNDRHGHLMGDEVLLGVARTIRRCLRRSDPVFRFGGEEFLVLFHGVPEASIRNVLERLRTRVAAENFNQVGRVTVSIGASRIGFDDRDDDPDAAIYRADTALYYAKRNGRNRADLYEDLLEGGLVHRPPERGTVELFEAA